MSLFRHELKMNKKSFLIWCVCIAVCCAGCVLLYDSLESSLGNLADTYSNLGAMSVALGMDKLSLATMQGFYGTEITMMFNLGCAMFACMLGIGMLSKEEGGHTSEFLNTLPISRTKIYFEKYISLIAILIAFNVIEVGVNIASLLLMDSMFEAKVFFLYHVASLIMQIELVSICYMISAMSKKVVVGYGIGFSIMFYALDMMCRIIPAIENAKYITPFYYCSAADIFSDGKLSVEYIIIGIVVSIICVVVGKIYYCKKDIAS